MIKWTICGLIALLGMFQYQYWKGQHNFKEIKILKEMIRVQEIELQTAKARNDALDSGLKLLKQYPLACEERARRELGMIKEGETFYLIVEPMR